MGTKDEMGAPRLSRRQWLLIVGRSGLVVATAGATNSIPRLALAATSVQDETPEGFLAYAYAQRAQAMTTKDIRLLEAIYDTANPRLMAFEKDRTAFMHDLGSRWQGTLLSYSTTVSLIDLKLSGSMATARIYEAVRVQWIPNPKPLSKSALKIGQLDPARAAAGVPRGPRGEITSVLGNRHEVALEKSNSGWRLVQDSYEEPDLYGASPDLLLGSWSAVWSGILPNSQLRMSAPSQEALVGDAPLGIMTTHTYDWNAAKNYALNRCSSYNSSYCTYNSCGGDCANFVSQCFRAGNQVADGSWKTFNGACGTCGTTSTNAGTDTWANNGYLRNWIINSGRGQAQSGINPLAVGDIVNYDWDGNGTYDHVTIVVDGRDGYTLICSHNVDRCSVPWDLGGARSYRFTHLYPTYNA